jgi:hypothetical protein
VAALCRAARERGGLAAAVDRTVELSTPPVVVISAEPWRVGPGNRPANCTRVKLDCSATLYQCVLVIHRYSWVLM